MNGGNVGRGLVLSIGSLLFAIASSDKSVVPKVGVVTPWGVVRQLGGGGGGSRDDFQKSNKNF